MAHGKIMKTDDSKINKTPCQLLVFTDTCVTIYGGSERHLYNFFSGMGDDFNAHVFQLYSEDSLLSNENLFNGKPNVKLMHTPLKSVLSFSIIKLLFEIRRYIKNNNIDIVVSYHEKSDIVNFLLNKLFRVKFVSISSKRDMGFKLSPLLKKLMIIINKKFDFITTPSESIRELLFTEYNTSKATTFCIPNGVDLDVYKQANCSRDKLRVKLNLATDSFVIGCVANMYKVKGHKYLINGFAKFLNENPTINATLVLVGRGELESELKSLAEFLKIKNNVVFVGFQSNVENWLKVFDISVNTSLSEGLSNALIESCSAGVPVLATLVGGNPEIITHKENGFLIEPENSEAVKDGLLYLYESKSRRVDMGHNARKKAEMLYSNEVMVSRLESFYLNTLKISSTQ